MLSRQDKITQLMKKWRAFPNVSTLGAYEYFSQSIRLNSVSYADYEAAFSVRNTNARLKVIPLLFHEVTHWVDHITTLWGVEYLVQQFKAINSRRNETVTELWQSVELMRITKRHHLAEYYTKIFDKGYEAHDGLPWQWQLSTGLMFDSNGNQNSNLPIAFTRFANSRGEDVCRVPFSIASLLEVNAMNVEMYHFANIINQLNESEKIVEQRLFASKMVKDLYDPLLAVYTVAAHFFANKIGLQDAAFAYRYASRLAGFCLNFPRQLFPKLVIPIAFDSWGERNNLFKQMCDRGYLYMLLVEHAKSLQVDDSDSWFSTVLERAGLPPIEDVRTIAESEIRQLFLQTEPGPAFNRQSHLFSIGHQHQLKHGLRLFSDYNGVDEFIPPIILSDGKIVKGRNAPGLVTSSDTGQWIDEAWLHSNAILDFVEACVP